jgi:hypothetical protein
MQDFQFFVTDDRSTAPLLMFIQTKDAERARFLAQRMLAEKHHHAVEVWAGPERLFSLGETDPLAA